MPTITELLVDNASVTAGGTFIFCSTLLDVTADVSLQVCDSWFFKQRWATCMLHLFFPYDRYVNLQPFFAHSQLHGVKPILGIWWYCKRERATLLVLRAVLHLVRRRRRRCCAAAAAAVLLWSCYVHYVSLLYVRGGHRSCCCFCSFFLWRTRQSFFQAALRDLVMQTRRGNVAGATSGAFFWSADVAAAVLLLLCCSRCVTLIMCISASYSQGV